MPEILTIAYSCLRGRTRRIGRPRTNDLPIPPHQIRRCRRRAHFQQAQHRARRAMERFARILGRGIFRPPSAACSDAASLPGRFAEPTSKCTMVHVSFSHVKPLLIRSMQEPNMSSPPDFSKEDLKGTPAEFAPGAWVLGHAHFAGGACDRTEF